MVSSSDHKPCSLLLLQLQHSKEQLWRPYLTIESLLQLSDPFINLFSPARSIFFHHEINTSSVLGPFAHPVRVIIGFG